MGTASICSATIAGVFEAKDRLEENLLDLMAAILDLGDGRYACLVERSGIVLETPEPEDGPVAALRRVIEARAASILGLAAALAGGGDMEDAFSGWADDEFLVAVLNERVALVVACPDAEALKADVDPPLRVLVDRLLRWKRGLSPRRAGPRPLRRPSPPRPHRGRRPRRRGSRSALKTFYRLLGIALLVVTTNNFVWFALTFWAFLTTRSVISTSVMGGIFLVLTAVSGFWFGSIVDHHRKKRAMLGSSVATLILFLIGLAVFHTTPAGAFASVSSVRLWVFVVILLSGTLAGTIYNIAIPTLVALIVPEDRRDRANGMFGTTIGIAFGLTSVASGISLAFGGMAFVLLAAAIATVLAIVLLALVPIPETEIVPRRGRRGGRRRRQADRHPRERSGPSRPCPGSSRSSSSPRSTTSWAACSSP